MTEKRIGTTLSRVADTIALVMWAPKTIDQISETSGVPRQTIAAHIKFLHEQGVIYVQSFRGSARVFAMQPKPFQFDDAKAGERVSA